MFRRAKAAVTGDLHAKLQEALAELRRLEAERLRIKSNIDIAQLGDTAQFDDAITRAKTKYAETNNVDDLVWLRCVEMVAMKENDTHMPMRFARQRWGGDGGAHAEFIRKHPQWREVLKRACECKLAVAKQQFEKIEREVREQLGNGFDADDLASEPRVKRAKRNVAGWECLLDGIAAAHPAEAWPRYVRSLLSDE